MLDVLFGAASDRGLLRQVNEDSAIASGPLAAVADGMGGHAAGDVASRIAIAALERLTSDVGPLQSQDVLAAIETANAEILEAGATNASRNGMGTTLCGVAVVTVGGLDHWMVFNVGDSRVYRADGSELAQITVDHSEVEEMVASGMLTMIEAKDHPKRHVVTRSLGTDPAPLADVWMFPPTAGERLVICSDGLPLELDDAVIREILELELDAQTAADALVAAAVAAGGRDNVTVVVVDVPRSTDAAMRDSGSLNTTPRRRVGGRL